MAKKPLVSLLLLFYNQEDFVEDAVKGALSQDYDNCEVILSDDCSTDNTFQKIKEIVKNYSGNKKLIINRNDNNLGLIKHINKCLFELSKGEIICLTGGDDVSLETRVTDTVDYFQSNPNLTALTMSYYIIDKVGNITGKRQINADETIKVSNKKYLTSDSMMWGLCGLAFSRIVLDIFGKLNDDCQTEDSVLRFRSILIGDVLTSAKFGLRYRVHGSNISHVSRIFKLKTLPISKQYERDLTVAKQYIESHIYHILKYKIKHYKRYRNLSEKISLTNIFIGKGIVFVFRLFSVWFYKFKVSWIEKSIMKIFKIRLLQIYNLLYFIINRNKILVIAGWMQSKGSKVLSNNFGDDINYALVSFLSGGQKVINLDGNVLFGNKINTVKYACIGSIVDTGFLDKNTIIWGSGSMFGDIKQFGIPNKVLSVRGVLTRKCFLEMGVDCPEIYGDPALLLPMVYPCKEHKKYKYGLIPHLIDFNLQNVKDFQEKYKDCVKVIDLHEYDDWREIVRQICQCEYVMSSSLHGLIVSDAYNIPNIWIKLSNNVAGGYFKYHDYFSAVNRNQKAPVNLMNKAIDPEIIMTEYKYEPIVIDREKLLDVCPFKKNNYA